MTNKIGFTCGVFDFVHPGHVAFLEACRTQCDYLIVGLQTAPVDRPEKNLPRQSTYDRWVQLRALTCVDEIIPYDTELDLTNILAIEPLSVRFVGEEYRVRAITGEHVCIERNIPLIFIPRQGHFSSRLYRTSL